jgi:DNA-binding NarL/FixJ family response regulator
MISPAPCRAALLIVDDSEMVRSYLRRLLSPTPHVTIAGEAGSVPEAIQRFEELKPDVVILDIEMPGGSGVDVLKWIKHREPSCLVIMFSSSPPDIYEPLCRRHGADHYFDKMKEFEALVELFGTTLAAPRTVGPIPESRLREAR